MKPGNIVIQLLIFLASNSLCQYVAASEEVLEAVPVPASVTSDIVAINILQNGHRLSIASVKSNATIDSIFDFYRDRWQDPVAEGLPGFVENTAGDWSIISRLHDGWNQVVQIRPAKQGVEGRISVQKLEPDPNGLPAIAMPGNASLVSSSGSNDIGHSSSTYVVFSNSGMTSVAGFYRRHFDTEGWSRVSDKNVNNAQVMLLQRSGERAELVISRMSTGGTLTVINKVVNDG